MTPAAESESRIGLPCSGRCSEPLESDREAREIEFGGLNNLLSFASETTPLPRYLEARFWAEAVQARRHFRSPESLLSRSDSSGSGHLLEQENPMRDSDSAAGVIIHASFRYLHRVAAGSLRTIYRSDL